MPFVKRNDRPRDPETGMLLKKDGTPRKPQGFAAINPERQRELQSKGGRSVKSENRAYSRNAELAASAGAKGGSVSPFTPEEQAARAEKLHAERLAKRVERERKRSERLAARKRGKR